MRKIVTGIAAASALALVATGAASPASADEAALGNQSLATVLTSDGNTFDKDWKDFDIVTEAVLAVLKAKPDSPVKALTDGSFAATAFVPNDRAFQLLVKDLTGKTYKKERNVFKKVAGLGIDTVETVLLYHVVPGTVPAATAVTLDDVRVKTVLGKTFKVNVVKNGTQIRLKDKDRNSRNPRVIATDVNAGNMQIAHVIDRVLRPLDLPPTVKH